MRTLINLVLLVLLAGLAWLGFTAYQLPDQYLYSQERLIRATPAVLFEQINNLQNFNTWSPWAKMDPNAKVTFEGTPSGTSAMMFWDGNMKVGKGSMAIIGSEPDKNVTYSLIFQKPLPGNATATIKLEPMIDVAQAGLTKVTWSMTGTSNIFEKMMGVILNCEGMIKNQFALGLASLAAKTEL